MRLWIIGSAVVAAGLAWLTCCSALADVPPASVSSVVSTDGLVSPADTFTSRDVARFQVDLLRPLPGESHLHAQRIHLATAAPLMNERAASSQAQVAAAAAQFASSPPDQAPSVWLMLAVTLVLIGYQLRRKHRLLRPHRFHRI